MLIPWSISAVGVRIETVTKRPTEQNSTQPIRYGLLWMYYILYIYIYVNIYFALPTRAEWCVRICVQETVFESYMCGDF